MEVVRVFSGDFSQERASPPIFVLFFRCFDVSEGVWTRFISKETPLLLKAKFACFSLCCNRFWFQDQDWPTTALSAAYGINRGPLCSTREQQAGLMSTARAAQ